jgi:hypothetical protein
MANARRSLTVPIHQLVSLVEMTHVVTTRIHNEAIAVKSQEDRQYTRAQSSVCEAEMRT